MQITIFVNSLLITLILPTRGFLSKFAMKFEENILLKKMMFFSHVLSIFITVSHFFFNTLKSNIIFLGLKLHTG